MATGDASWLGRAWGDRGTYSRVLALPSWLDKWKGVWLLLSHRTVLQAEFRQPTDPVAVHDAVWVLNWLREQADDPEVHPLASWVRNVRLYGVLAAVPMPPPAPNSNLLRVEKSLYLLVYNLNAALDGRRSNQWGIHTFNLHLLRLSVKRYKAAKTHQALPRP